MATTIFYSWQSDSASKTNHRFIKEALEVAVSKLVEDGHVEEAPRVEHDTKGVHGDPDIFPTILKKIEECDVFIADVTFVASTSGGKNIPNPNVLIELGYAYKSAGSGRIIKIMNDSYGDPSKGLPFDLAHKRWPYTYCLPEEADKTRREKVKETVAKDLAGYIRHILEKEGPKSEDTSNLTNSSTLTSITVTPSNSFISQGSTQQFTAIAQYSDGTTAELSTDITWISLNLYSLDRLRAYTPKSINLIQLGDLSPLTHEAKLAEARRQFNDISTHAKSGDANSIGAMQSISTIFLSLSRQYYASSAPYFADFATVKNVLMEIVSVCLDAAAVNIANAPALASLEAFTHILTLSDLGGLSPENKLTEARNLFADLSKRAKLGDTKALWQLETVSKAYLEASNLYFGGKTGYANDFNTILEIQSLDVPIAPATIETDSGLANGIALGTSIITASSKGISGTAILNITIS